MNRFFAALLVALLLCPFVLGQGADESLVTDPNGDVTGTAGSTNPASDLTRLTIQEDSNRWLITVGVASLDDSKVPFLDNALYQVFLTYKDADYRVTITRIQPLNAGPATYTAELYKSSDAEQSYATTGIELAVESDNEADTMRFSLPFISIEGASGFPVASGQQLVNIYVESHNDAGPDGGDLDYLRYDRMPDTGAATWTIKEATSEGASFFAAIPSDVRYTNGGVVTYAFEVITSNGGTEALELQYEATNVVEPWSLEFVNQVYSIQPGEVFSNVAIIKGTFGHRHGSTTTFPITVSTLDGSDTVELEASIIFTETPQPAGHHSTIWLHSIEVDPAMLPREIMEATGSNFVEFYMSTLEEEERDVHRSADYSNHGDFNGWRIPLEPGLGIGLDFEVSEPSHYKLGFQPNLDGVPVNDFKVSGAIVIGQNGTYRAAATLSEQPVMTLDSQVWVEGTIESTEYGDLIPYEDGNQMWLEIYVEFASPDQSTVNWPELLPGGYLQLPLVEYEDPLPLVAANIELDVPAGLSANPGLQGAFPLTLTNNGLEAAEVRMQFLGIDKVWNLDAASTSIRIEPGRSKDVTISLSVPPDLEEGSQIEFFAVARDDSGGAPAIQAIRIDVVTGKPGSIHGQHETEAPVPGMALVLVGLVLAMTVRRRPRTA